METQFTRDLELIAKELGIDLSELRERPKTLEGLWEGVKITDRDIEESKKAVFPNRRLG